jgi:glucokinase
MTKQIPLVLAGDIGATHLRLGIYENLICRFSRTYKSTDYDGLEKIAQDFLHEAGHGIDAAAFGLPGPIIDNQCRTTNLPWLVDGQRLSEVLKAPVRLFNDLEICAYGVRLLNDNDMITINEGVKAKGNQVVLAAGTGLGQAGLVLIEGQHHPIATEGGHVGFSPNGQKQIELLSFLERERKHVSWEHVLSGPGLCNIYRSLLHTNNMPEPEWYKAAPHSATIIKRARDLNDPICQETLQMFSELCGAEAGNLALKYMAFGGVFIAGGLPPRVLTPNTFDAFLKAFFEKGVQNELMKQMPVKLITSGSTALLGAADWAERQYAQILQKDLRKAEMQQNHPVMTFESDVYNRLQYWR